MHFETIRQISIALENHPGALHRAAAELARHGINVEGIAVNDYNDRGVVRLRTSDPERAQAVLRAIGFEAMGADVFEFVLPDQPGRLADLCRAMTVNGVNIDYAYGTSNREAQHVRVEMAASPVERAREVLARLPE